VCKTGRFRGMRMLERMRAAILVALFPFAFGAHEVTNLPGFDGPLPSKWVVGFVPSGTKEGHKLFHHYEIVYSENDPEKDPLLLWTNGGPGGASMGGLMGEIGPFSLTRESIVQASDSGVPKLFQNPHAWNKHANLLFMNGPPPVEFSYCDPPGPGGGGFQCGSEAWNDTTTAKANFNFLESFFEAHPEFEENEVYIAGESYAGIYIPTLVREILNAPSSSKSKKALRGVAIGNGCVGMDVVCGDVSKVTPEVLFQVEFLHGHGQFSTKLYNEIQSNCNDQIGHYSKCSKLIKEMQRQVGSFYPYSLYDTCWGDELLRSDNRDENVEFLVTENKNLGKSRRLQGALNNYSCGQSAALKQWIEHPEVRKALHIPKEAVFNTGDNAENIAYEPSEKNLMPFMKHLATDTDLRVLIYNGDTDPTVNVFVSEWWVNELGLREKEPWSPWTLDGKFRIGGYITRYEGDFDFLTIRGSGHFVPTYKAAAAQEAIINRWLMNKPYKAYNP